MTTISTRKSGPTAPRDRHDMELKPGAIPARVRGGRTARGQPRGWPAARAGPHRRGRRRERAARLRVRDAALQLLHALHVAHASHRRRGRAGSLLGRPGLRPGDRVGTAAVAGRRGRARALGRRRATVRLRSPGPHWLAEVRDVRPDTLDGRAPVANQVVAHGVAAGHGERNAPGRRHVCREPGLVDDAVHPGGTRYRVEDGGRADLRFRDGRRRAALVSPAGGAFRQRSGCRKRRSPTRAANSRKPGWRSRTTTR